MCKLQVLRVRLSLTESDRAEYLEDHDADWLARNHIASQVRADNVQRELDVG